VLESCAAFLQWCAIATLSFLVVVVGALAWVYKKNRRRQRKDRDRDRDNNH